jgi:hypothetical protein
LDPNFGLHPVSFQITYRIDVTDVSISTPVAVSLPGPNIEVFTRGADNHLYHIWTNSPGQWNPAGWMSLGQQIPAA